MSVPFLGINPQLAVEIPGHFAKGRCLYGFVSDFRTEHGPLNVTLLQLDLVQDFLEFLCLGPGVNPLFLKQLFQFLVVDLIGFREPHFVNIILDSRIGAFQDYFIGVCCNWGISKRNVPIPVNVRVKRRSKFRRLITFRPVAVGAYRDQVIQAYCEYGIFVLAEKVIQLGAGDLVRPAVDVIPVTVGADGEPCLPDKPDTHGDSAFYGVGHLFVGIIKRLVGREQDLFIGSVPCVAFPDHFTSFGAVYVGLGSFQLLERCEDELPEAGGSVPEVRGQIFAATFYDGRLCGFVYFSDCFFPVGFLEGFSIGFKLYHGGTSVGIFVRIP